MDKKIVYLDNSCTSFPKAEGVEEVIYDYLKNNVSNINRSSYNRANNIEELVYDTRSVLNNFFNGYDIKNVIFTKNITESLNLVINGLFKNGDHIIISSIEHNAILRPLVNLKKNNISFDKIPLNSFYDLDIDKIEKLIKKNTKAIILTHASNVSGIINPIKKIGEIAKKNNLYFILDSAQTAGVIDIDMKLMNISCLAFTGHKYLLGPQGIGGFLVSDDLIDKIDPLIYGGTGSISDSEYMPNFLPDKYEAGTLNIPGILGLKKSIEYINKISIKKIKNHEEELTKIFLQELKNLENKNLLNIIGHKDLNNRLGVISIITDKIDLSHFAYQLDSEYNIMVRVGLHCAPLAHIAYNTYPIGTIRFSIGYKNTINDIEYTIGAIKKILSV